MNTRMPWDVPGMVAARTIEGSMVVVKNLKRASGSVAGFVES